MDLIQYRDKHGSDAWHELAPKAKTSYAYLTQLAHGHRKASPRMVGRLIQATDGELTREALRPDIYGPVDGMVA